MKTFNKQNINRILFNLAEKYTDALQESLGGRLFAVILFGSVARREATQYSDIDLLIVVDRLEKGRLHRAAMLEKPDRAVQGDLMALWEKGIYTDVVPVLKSAGEAERIVPLYLDLVEDGIILFEKDKFFTRILNRLQQSLHRLGAVRLQSGHIRYWDLKPDLKPGEIFSL